MSIHEISSGEVVEDWVIPDEWNVESAFIKDLKGNTIIDFKDNNLHLLGYSRPIDKKITLEELNCHLYSLPDYTDAIPYVTSYYNSNWGFCISDNDRKKLKDKNYYAYINSAFTRGSLTYSDLIIPGKQTEEIFFSTYI